MSYYTNTVLQFADFAEYSAWYDDKIEYELIEDDDIEYEVVADDFSSDSVDLSFYNFTNIFTLSNKLEKDMKVITKMCDDADIGFLVFKHKYTQYKRNMLYKYFTKFKKIYLKTTKSKR
jgi:hypothetical protein